MRRKWVFYVFGFLLLVVNLILCDKAYNALTGYIESTNRQNTVLRNYQALSRQINNAAVLSPTLRKAGNYQIAAKLFFTDSLTVIRHLDLLKMSVRDSLNIQTTKKLDTLIKSELSWLLNSDVPDSIIDNKSPKHLAAFERIDSLIAMGIKRTNLLIEFLKSQLNDALKKVEISIILFVVVSGTLLFFTTINFFKQQTKTKRKEKELETVFNRINDSVVSVDNNWRYTFLNDIALSTHPLGKEETLGKVIWDIHPDMRGTIFWEKYHEAMQTKKVVEIESYYSPMDTWFSVKVYPSSDGLTIFYKDISKTKKAERDIAELNRTLEEKIKVRTGQLKKSNEELEAFSYSVSHDLRAPLRGIIAFARILEDEYSSKLDTEAKRITSIIRDNALKMGTLIDDLLAFSRMGKQGLTKVQVNTDLMVREIAKEQEQINDRQDPISWTIHNLPPLYADANTLRQVWINLISNAIKYSGNEERPHIEIGSYPDKDQLVFYIKDNGAGFDEEYKDKLFKVFQRLHDADEFEGTGIGLALVEKIISRHEGKVWAEGKEGEGACFYFSLP